MQLTKYLVISAKKDRYGGLSPVVRLAEREPKLQGNEIAVRLSLALPNEFFKRPTFEVRMTVPDEAVPKTAITAKTVDDIEKIVKETTGLNITVALVEHPEKEAEE